MGEDVIVQGTYIRETEGAVLLDYGMGVTWIPRSQISYMKKGQLEKGKRPVTMHIPKWLANERKLDYEEKDF